MSKHTDIKGKRFGKLIAISFRETRGKSNYWTCICDCGRISIVRKGHLVSGSVRSCGCMEGNFKHGHSKGGKESSVYHSWRSMKQRCDNENNKHYSDYGGRGISYCERWTDFSNFLEDMGEPEKGMSLDRIDNDGDYTPKNCRWATPKEQNRNRRDNVWITFNGKTLIKTDMAREYNLNVDTLDARLKKGWSLEKALKTSVKGATLETKTVEMNE